MNWHVFGKAFLCETLYSIPFFILALFPFRKQLRFSLKSITFFIFLGQLFQSSCYVYLVAHGKPTRITDIIFAVVCLSLYFLCVKANAWKLLFLCFFIFNYMVTLRGICFFLESWFFSGSDLTFYSLHNESMLIIFVFLFFTLPLGLRFMKNARERVFQVDSPAFWHKAWFLPFSGTFIICVHNFDLSIDVVRTPRFILTRIWLLLMTVMVYSILLEAFDIIRQQTVLKERAAQQETLLAIQRTQYQQLSRHMETVRQARHDLRQHLNVIDHYLSSGKTEDLKSYIEQYRMTLPPDTARTWCENYAVNTIVCYYGEEARKAGIDFSVRLELPKRLSTMNRRYVPFSEISWKMRWMSAGNAKILLLLSASAPGKKAGILHWLWTIPAAAPLSKKTANSVQASMRALASEPPSVRARSIIME